MSSNSQGGFMSPPELKHQPPRPETPKELPVFIEKEVDLKVQQTECVDGRPSDIESQGAKMPGAAAFLGVLDSIVNNKVLNEQAIADSITKLKLKDNEPRYEVGVHRDDHEHEENGSGCGFADQIQAIIKLAQDKKEDIRARMEAVYADNQAFFDENNIDLMSMIDGAYEKLLAFSNENIQISGEELINAAVDSGAKEETVLGNHGERVAFVNLKPDTTLDSKKLNAQGQQAFNLDLWAVQEMAQVFGISEADAIGLSLILYQATEMQLVERKGNTALPVKLNY